MKETQRDRDRKKMCIKHNSIVFVKKKKKTWQSALIVNFGIFSPLLFYSGIMVITNQKNKACVIVSGKAHRSKDTTYKYKIHVRCSCTFHTYMVPFLRGVSGLFTCSHCGTVPSVIYAWSLDSPCKKVCTGKYICRMDLILTITRCYNHLFISPFISYCMLLLRYLSKSFIYLNSFLCINWPLCYLHNFIKHRWGYSQYHFLLKIFSHLLYDVHPIHPMLLFKKGGPQST